jgi:hypothetical protein
MLSLRAEDISGDEEDWDLPTLVAVDFEQRSSSNVTSTPSPPVTVVTSSTYPPNTVQAGDGIAGGSGANRATPVVTGPTTSDRSTSPFESTPLDFWVADNGRVYISPINILHPPGVIALLRANPTWALDDLLARLIDEGCLSTSGSNWKSRYAAISAIEYGQRSVVNRTLRRMEAAERGTVTEREAVIEQTLREFEAVRDRPTVASGLTVMRQREEARRRSETIVISSDDDD